MRTPSGKGGNQYEDTFNLFSDPGGDVADGARHLASSRRRGSRQSNLREQQGQLPKLPSSEGHRFAVWSRSQHDRRASARRWRRWTRRCSSRRRTQAELHARACTWRGTSLWRRRSCECRDRRCTRSAGGAARRRRAAGKRHHDCRSSWRSRFWIRTPWFPCRTATSF